jgi:hypothetical protein
MTEQNKALLKLALILAALLIANAVAPVLATYLDHDEQTFLLLGAVYLGGAIFAVRTRQQLNTFIRNWPTSLIYTAVILYTCKILAEKVINARTGIEVENIRYASTIGGFMYSVPFSMVVISLYMFTKMAIRLSLPVAIKIESGPFLDVILKACFIASLLWAGLFTIERADAFMPYTVLADTTKVTTCGPVEDYVFYVRKNADTCKKIYVRPLQGIYESTDVASKSG